MIETVLSIVALSLSAIIAGYGIIKKVQKSNCVLQLEDGTEFNLNFDELANTIANNPELRQLKTEDVKKFQEVLKKSIEKLKESSSPRGAESI